MLNGISTHVGYLMPKSVNICMICKRIVVGDFIFKRVSRTNLFTHN